MVGWRRAHNWIGALIFVTVERMGGVTRLGCHFSVEKIGNIKRTRAKLTPIRMLPRSNIWIR